MKTGILLVFILLNLIGFSQAVNQSTNLEHDFSNTNLQAKHIAAFENRAIQKVHDFCNYVQLISDKDYEEKFRAHSKKTALSLFNSIECSIADSLLTGKQDNLMIEEYFTEIFQTDYHKIIGEASDIIMSNDLKQMDKDNYSGKITFLYQLNFYNQQDELVQSVSERKVVDVTLSRKAKAFGDIEKVIWVVDLCDISPE